MFHIPKKHRQPQKGWLVLFSFGKEHSCSCALLRVLFSAAIRSQCQDRTCRDRHEPAESREERGPGSAGLWKLDAGIICYF